MASMTHQVDGPTTPGETGLLPTASTHPECPFAAFFLSQSSAVSTDAACLSDVVFSSPLNEHVTASLTSRAVPALIARGPPAGILISA